MLPVSRSLGVIGGLEPQAEAHFLSQLNATLPRARIVLERCAPGQLNILDAILRLADRGVQTVALPGFCAYPFFDELQANSPLPIANMFAALRSHVRSRYPAARRIGVTISVGLHLFERAFPEYEVLHPPMDGAQLIISTDPGPHVIDPYQVYAQFVLTQHLEPTPRQFKLGVVGGVGPAATVDFLRKVVRNTPAHRDQDHLKIVVEQNPQIPDRTDHLLGRGPDPTLALYATCRRLQAGGADLIAIPCNTAHAYIEEIQPHLDIPIINMLQATAGHLIETFPKQQKVGLLATTGTISSGIYHRALQSRGLSVAVPPPVLQARMMEAIYGARGIKAGHTSGPCVEDIHEVIGELVSRGIEVIVLGCTELPLVLNELTRATGRPVTFVDPTDILAVRCVSEAHKLPASEASTRPTHAFGAA